METRRLGRDGPAVSVLGYGAMALRDALPADAARVLNTVLDVGITFIDTAPDYLASEDHIGRAIAHRRDEYVLATKFGCDPPRRTADGRPIHVWTPERLRANLESSLARLCTDHIDLWQAHSAAPDELERAGLVDVLFDAKHRGLVRQLGLSTRGQTDDVGAGQLGAYLDAGWKWPDVIQTWYSALHPESRSHLARASQQGLGTIVRGVMRGSRQHGSVGDVALALGLGDLLDDGEQAADLMLRHALSGPGVDVVLVGTSSEARVRQNARTAGRGALPADLVTEIDSRVADDVLR